MTIKLYNTLTRKKEKLKTVENNLVKIYVCGVTIYDDIHLGHALSYTYYDILINYLKHFLGYDVFYVRNITDVGHLTEENEDKIENRAKERKTHPMELVYKYSRRMWKYFEKLNLDDPNIEPYATAHILDMQEWIKKIIKNGFAYEVNGNVYYDISKFKDYYKFSNRKPEELLKNTRFENDPDKKNPQDFALWIKAKKGHLMKWPSPWSIGYPGWHLECSVMSTKYLGDSFDIHGGGIEHVFPHHTNEIAQNYAFYKKKVVNHWVHTEMLLVEGKKMGKSLGNFITVEDFLKKHSAESFRFLVSAGHYRKPQNYTKQSIVNAENSLKKVNLFISRLLLLNNNPKNNKIVKEIIENTKNNFKKAMNDDLNTPSAWASIFFLIKEINKLIDQNKVSKEQAKEILSFLRQVNLVFKVFNFKEESKSTSANKISEEEINKLIEKRKKLRASKKYEEADKIRLMLEKKNVILNDVGSDTSWQYV
jgi:cysteinyl-tRNA synthetase